MFIYWNIPIFSKISFLKKSMSKGVLYPFFSFFFKGSTQMLVLNTPFDQHYNRKDLTIFLVY